jgi:hypothetical protein
MDIVIATIYRRKPQTSLYNAHIREYRLENKKLTLVRELAMLVQTSMQKVLEELHQQIQPYKSAQLWMQATPWEPQPEGARTPPVHKLPPDMGDLIRNNLPAAIEAFAPIQFPVPQPKQEK